MWASELPLHPKATKKPRKNDHEKATNKPQTLSLPLCQGHISAFCTRTWVKTGRYDIFLVLCLLGLGGHCLQLLCLPGFGTHANNQNLPHFRAFPASIQEHSPPKCLFVMANAKLTNRPGFALLHSAPPEPEFGAEFCETNFGRPNFGPEFLGRFF